MSHVYTFHWISCDPLRLRQTGKWLLYFMRLILSFPSFATTAPVQIRHSEWCASLPSQPSVSHWDPRTSLPGLILIRRCPSKAERKNQEFPAKDVVRKKANKERLFFFLFVGIDICLRCHLGPPNVDMECLLCTLPKRTQLNWNDLRWNCYCV